MKTWGQKTWGQKTWGQTENLGENLGTGKPGDRKPGDKKTWGQENLGTGKPGDRRENLGTENLGTDGTFTSFCGPQRLKPHSVTGFIGTTEVVPFPTVPSQPTPLPFSFLNGREARRPVRRAPFTFNNLTPYNPSSNR